ncbi:MAG: cytochrome c3 family protein [Verrucomicrobiota bacterium]
MPQVFGPGSNAVARATLVVGVLLVIAAGAGSWAVWSSPYMTRQHLALDQPVPFSHKHHHGALGIDCRYCHTSAETSSSAGMPSTETCMTCHSQVWTQAPVLQPVRESWRTGQPIRWTRVYDNPDYVYFDHSIHVQKGIGCSSCHGRVDQMPLLAKEHTLWMRWCLDCHRHPEEHVRPREQVFSMQYQPPVSQLETGRALVNAYQIDAHRLTDCSLCHR